MDSLLLAYIDPGSGALIWQAIVAGVTQRAAIMEALLADVYGPNKLVGEGVIPAAVVALKQGVGRLIRDAHDRGVLMLCDPRLLTRSYGGLFLDNLPPMPRTRALAEVERFFAARRVEDGAAVASAGAAAP